MSQVPMMKVMVCAKNVKAVQDDDDGARKSWMGCDTCTRWFHYQCIGLKAIPAGFWSCQYCSWLLQNWFFFWCIETSIWAFLLTSQKMSKLPRQQKSDLSHSSTSVQREWKFDVSDWILCCCWGSLLDDRKVNSSAGTVRDPVCRGFVNFIRNCPALPYKLWSPKELLCTLFIFTTVTATNSAFLRNRNGNSGPI